MAKFKIEISLFRTIATTAVEYILLVHFAKGYDHNLVIKNELDKKINFKNKPSGNIPTYYQTWWQMFYTLTIENNECFLRCIDVGYNNI